jgi:hypothetical protein
MAPLLTTAVDIICLGRAQAKPVTLAPADILEAIGVALTSNSWKKGYARQIPPGSDVAAGHP